MAFVITEPCIGVKDMACVPACPCDVIHPGEKMLYIDPAGCIDCAACQSACPTQAIYADGDVPAPWAHFAAINAAFFPEHDEAKAWAAQTAR